jgi:phytoene synthase
MMDAIATSLREVDAAQFFAALFIPEEQRSAVMVLRTFAAEMSRIPFLVSEPMLGEIRFQWWHEVLAGEREGEAAAHPLASALIQTVRKHSLPIAALQGLIAARVEDLYADPPPTMNDLEGRLGECHSVPYRLASMILVPHSSASVADVAGHGGVAEGLAHLLAHWPLLLRRSRVMIPQDVMAQFGLSRESVLAGTASAQTRTALRHIAGLAEKHRAQATAALVGLRDSEAPAFLPLALVDPLLKRVHRTLPDDVASLPQWRIQFCLWRASRRDVAKMF